MQRMPHAFPTLDDSLSQVEMVLDKELGELEYVILDEIPKHLTDKYTSSQPKNNPPPQAY